MDDSGVFVEYVLSLPGAPRVLDFGAGRGGTVRALRDAGIDAYGADRFFAGMDWASVRGGDLMRDGYLREIDKSDRLPFADGEFQVVVSDQVLEHVEDLRAAVEEMHRVLAPGGRMYHQFPTLEVIREAHFALPWIHRLPHGLRWRFMYACRRLGFGKHTAEHVDPREWAIVKSAWIDEFCVYRRWSDIEREFARLGYVATPREVEYCQFRARNSRPLRILLGFGPLAPLVRVAFRALGFRAIEFTQAAPVPAASMT